MSQVRDPAGLVWPPRGPATPEQILRGTLVGPACRTRAPAAGPVARKSRGSDRGRSCGLTRVAPGTNFGSLCCRYPTATPSVCVSNSRAPLQRFPTCPTTRNMLLLCRIRDVTFLARQSPHAGNCVRTNDATRRTDDPNPQKACPRPFTASWQMWRVGLEQDPTCLATE